MNLGLTARVREGCFQYIYPEGRPDKSGENGEERSVY